MGDASQHGVSQGNIPFIQRPSDDDIRQTCFADAENIIWSGNTVRCDNLKTGLLVHLDRTADIYTRAHTIALNIG